MAILWADDILEMLGDKQSKRSHLLVARKVPEGNTRGILSEPKENAVRSKARLFTSKVLEFSEFAMNHQLEHEMEAMKSNLGMTF